MQKNAKTFLFKMDFLERFGDFGFKREGLECLGLFCCLEVFLFFNKEASEFCEAY